MTRNHKFIIRFSYDEINNSSEANNFDNSYDLFSYDEINNSSEANNYDIVYVIS